MAVNPLDTTNLNLDAPLKAAQVIREYVEDLKTVPLPEHQAKNETMQEVDLAAVVEDLGRVVAQHRGYMAIQQSIGVGDIPYADHSGALARLLDEIVQELRRLGMWSGDGILFKSSPAGMSASVDWARLKQIVTSAMAGGPGGVTDDFDIVMEVKYDKASSSKNLSYRTKTFSFENGLLVNVFDPAENWHVFTTAEACP